MPEFPEVALLARDLSRISSQMKLSRVRFHGEARFLNKIVPAKVQEALRSMKGQRLDITCSGKALVLSSEIGTVTLRLGMTGQFQLKPVRRHYRRHHFATFEWGEIRCRFLDFRRFARMRLESPDRQAVLGGFTPARGFFLTPKTRLESSLQKKLRDFSKSPRISWLLRHGKDTGIGNYLANEGLGRLNLSPFVPCQSESEALRILKMCQAVAKRSYQSGGTSFGIGYFRLDGSTGEFSNHLQFYKNQSVRRTVFRKRPVYSAFNCAGEGAIQNVRQRGNTMRGGRQ